VGGRAAVTVRAPAIAVIFHEVFLAASFPTSRSAASGWSDLASWAVRLRRLLPFTHVSIL
jgi:hypothetical protein